MRRRRAPSFLLQRRAFIGTPSTPAPLGRRLREAVALTVDSCMSVGRTESARRVQTESARRAPARKQRAISPRTSRENSVNTKT